MRLLNLIFDMQEHQLHTSFTNKLLSPYFLSKFPLLLGVYSHWQCALEECRIAATSLGLHHETTLARH